MEEKSMDSDSFVSISANGDINPERNSNRWVIEQVITRHMTQFTSMFEAIDRNAIVTSSLSSLHVQ